MICFKYDTRFSCKLKSIKHRLKKLPSLFELKIFNNLPITATFENNPISQKRFMTFKNLWNSILLKGNIFFTSYVIYYYYIVLYWLFASQCRKAYPLINHYYDHLITAHNMTYANCWSINKIINKENLNPTPHVPQFSNFGVNKAWLSYNA